MRMTTRGDFVKKVIASQGFNERKQFFLADLDEIKTHFVKKLSGSHAECSEL